MSHYSQVEALVKIAKREIPSSAILSVFKENIRQDCYSCMAETMTEDDMEELALSIAYVLVMLGAVADPNVFERIIQGASDTQLRELLDEMD